MKRFLFVGLFFLLAFSILGCGGSGGGSSPAPTPTDFTAFTTAQKVDMAIASTLPYYTGYYVIEGSSSAPLKSISYKADVVGACSSGSLDLTANTATYSECQLSAFSNFTVDGTLVLDDSRSTITYDLTARVVYDSENYDVTMTGVLLIGEDAMYSDFVLVDGSTTYNMVAEFDTSGTGLPALINIAFGALYAHCDLTNVDPETQSFSEIMAQFGTDYCSNALEDSALSYSDAQDFGLIFSGINASFMTAVDGGEDPCLSGSLEVDVIPGVADFSTCEFVYNGEIYTVDGTITVNEAEGSYTFDLNMSASYGGTDYSYSADGVEIFSDVSNFSMNFSIDNDGEDINFISESMTLNTSTFTLSGDMNVSNDVDVTCSFSNFEYANVGVISYQDFFLSSACE